ncbi:uncharacterized protein Z518_01931 [Rhinocladiella mackenziei CBS 650.93]|uniref:BZIP domain-containing protein n=1 Tax=Rhinocladiella mackenziei CBS 650.93 TaxID=1442369 RepID=A0A0D2H9V9_9EURO|nr:uncharacterized protein Z518_01931 [Rhinocladiella mackenziei CBS 650.93]KIX07278.1 hypothetical protein Z518_01931 [Rhinocladiella mackenziei CBS 650.93]
MAFPTSQSNMSNLNTNFDPDYDSFLNLENDFTPSSTSPGIKSASMLTPQSSIPGSATTFGSSSTSQTFPGPSFQYDAYHQQTGIPIGALASTFNINKATGLQYHEGNGGFIMPTETLNVPLSNLDEFDFNRNHSDMDFDADSPNDFMFSQDRSSGPSQFVSPNTLVAQNNTTSTPIQRIYPGMHSQQAAQAKAQQAQKQEQMARQQQPLPKGQMPLPGPAASKSQPVKDPLVEESISKVLNRMRQASVASTTDEQVTPVTGMANIPRIKKDEDEMDEDERLLASEEGKKLSSKERRQLRNKVSARAFRSRRKEYIGQLEGEVAAKSQEANDLRVQNQQLREENNRLTDLTRMLLSSQAFSGFLQELSQSGASAPNTQNNSQTQKPAPNQPQPTRKDIGAHEAANQMQLQQPQVGMALIPEVPVDLSTLQSSNGWMTALPTNDFQVYAVTELPEPPILDLESLSGKSKSNSSASSSSKDTPRLPEVANEFANTQDEPNVPQVDESVSLDRGAFALYFDAPAPVCEESSSLVGSKGAAKNEELSNEERMTRLEKMCSELDELCKRLAQFSPQESSHFGTMR